MSVYDTAGGGDMSLKAAAVAANTAACDKAIRLKKVFISISNAHTYCLWLKSLFWPL